MQLDGFWGFFFVVAIVAAVTIVFGAMQSHKRRKMLGEWAASRGWYFHPAANRSFDSQYPMFDVLQRGSGRKALHVVDGEHQGRSILAFDYQYSTGSGKNRRTYRFSAVIIEAPLVLKPLRIRAEGFFDKVSAFFGRDDIDFESAEFSKRFHVTADDRRWAYDVLHARAIEFLLSAPAHSIEFGTTSAIIWRERQRLDPTGFESAIAIVEKLYALMPDYVVEQQRSLYGDVSPAGQGRRFF